MTRRTIEPAQQTAGRVAGFTYLFTLTTVVSAQFGIHDRLIVEGDAPETVRNIMAHERIISHQYRVCASTSITLACRSVDWHRQLAATCGLSRPTSLKHWLRVTAAEEPQ
jgi:hypothetical protein